jgi:hypothetical protein
VLGDYDMYFVCYAAAGGSAAVLSEQWTKLLQDVMPLICRCEILWVLLLIAGSS